MYWRQHQNEDSFVRAQNEFFEPALFNAISQGFVSILALIRENNWDTAYILIQMFKLLKLYKPLFQIVE